MEAASAARHAREALVIKLIVASGQYGDLILEPASGKVMSMTMRVPAEYADHDSADLSELRQWRREELGNLVLPHEISVLEVGWWLANGSYLAPSHEYRAQLVKAHALLHPLNRD